MKGVVLEVRGRRALVLAEDGSFRRIRCRYPLYVGQAVELGRPERVPAWAALPAALSLTAVLFLLFFLPRPLWRPAAYATLDINPSVEFALGGRGEVKSARGLDPEGALVLAKARVRGLPLSQAVEAVVERAKEEGYVRPGGRIILALAPSRPGPPEGRVEREFQRAREVARKWGQREKLRVIGAASDDPGVLKAARKKNLSLGLYLVGKEAGLAPAASGEAPRPGAVPAPLVQSGRGEKDLFETGGREAGPPRRQREKAWWIEELVPVLEDEDAGQGRREERKDERGAAAGSQEEKEGSGGGIPGSGESGGKALERGDKGRGAGRAERDREKVEAKEAGEDRGADHDSEAARRSEGRGEEDKKREKGDSRSREEGKEEGD